MQDIMLFIGNHPLLCAAALIVLVAVVSLEWLRAKRNIFVIPPTQVTQLINRENAVLIDIRPKDNYRQGHIINAHSISTREIMDDIKKLEKFRAKPIIIIAQASHEGQKVAAFLLKNGYNAYSLAGGIPAWNEAQMPLVKE